MKPLASVVRRPTDGQLAIGIVTDRDLVLRVLARGLGGDVSVSEVMTPVPVDRAAGNVLKPVVSDISDPQYPGRD